jgi:hypothetical protein
MAFMGGSAYAMANSLMEGFVLPSPINLKRLSMEELRELQFEVEKLLRDLRSLVPDQNDTLALQRRNQKLMRLQQAVAVIVNFASLRARGRA